MPSLGFASVDDFLGPRDSRFLGEGFKRVEYSLRDITVSPGADGIQGVEATAHISIPGVWSRKGDRHQRPHLSTIDAMLIGPQLAGLYAAHTFGLPPHAHFAVRSVEMRAGKRPDEDELAKLPVSARLVATTSGGTERSTTVDCLIGSLSARVEVAHSAGGAPSGTSRVYDVATELPGPWNDTPYGVPYRARRQLLTEVSASVGGTADPRASARVTLTPQQDAEGATGAAANAPATMIDAFVAVLQLGQVLVYAMDGLDRAQSNTMWMRRTRITASSSSAGPSDQPDQADQPDQPDQPDEADRATARLEHARLLPDGADTWRTADVVGGLDGVRIRTSVAHLLPASPPGDPLRRE